ncbi:polysaccharide pyruvyl transferase family protein [Patescibacteria group bacterium]
MQEYNLKKYLNKYKNTKVDFFRFPRNYGDSLIWHGTKKLLSSLNISEKNVDLASPKYNKILFIDGGGNFVDYYSDVRDFLFNKPSLYNEIIILPHTIFGKRQIEILKNVSSKLTVFCREKISASCLTNKIGKGKVYLWHDCAFYNDFPHDCRGKGDINIFRLDKESILKKHPALNKDISGKGYATKSLDEFVATIRPYQQINTDRLHVAICAVLLGKQVKLYPNLYYKNKAVFDYSLHKYSNVEFIEY